MTECRFRHIRATVFAASSACRFHAPMADRAVRESSSTTHIFVVLCPPPTPTGIDAESTGRAVSPPTGSLAATSY